MLIDLLAITITLCGLGLWLWSDMRREERQRREWLRIHNPESYEDEFGELYEDHGEPVG